MNKPLLRRRVFWIISIPCLLFVVGWFLDDLLPRYTLHGVLIDQNGKPIPFVNLKFRSHESRPKAIIPFPFGETYESSIVVTVQTDKDGTFSAGSPRRFLDVISCTESDIAIERYALQRSWNGPEEATQLRINSRLRHAISAANLG